MIISVAGLDLFDLAGNIVHTDIEEVACELSGHLCDLAERATRVQSTTLAEVQPFQVEHSFNGSSNQTYANPLVE